MKKYENESTFVNMFSKDCKESIKNGQQFEAQWNNVTIVVTGMDNNNSSKVTMYTGTINGVAFTCNITTLKKRLNIEYTKAYNRTNESARSANTKVVIKSDSELAETAKVANERIMQAVATIRKYSDKYKLGMAATFVGIESVEALVLQALQKERESAKKALAEKEAKEAAAKEAAAKEAAAKEAAAKEAAAKEAQKATLLAKIAEATAKQDFETIIKLSSQLKALTK